MKKEIKSEYTFSSKKQNIIKIGRKRTCDIAFTKDDRVSRIQCTFLFDNNEWVLYDGEIDERKTFHNSTNGLWKLITEKVIIYNLMEVKLASTTIICYVK